MRPEVGDENRRPREAARVDAGHRDRDRLKQPLVVTVGSRSGRGTRRMHRWRSSGPAVSPAERAERVHGRGRWIAASLATRDRRPAPTDEANRAWRPGRKPPDTCDRDRSRSPHDQPGVASSSGAMPAETWDVTPCGSSWNICTTVPLVNACTIAPVAGSNTTAASRTLRPVSR